MFNMWLLDRYCDMRNICWMIKTFITETYYIGLRCTQRDIIYKNYRIRVVAANSAKLCRLLFHFYKTADLHLTMFLQEKILRVMGYQMNYITFVLQIDGLHFVHVDINFDTNEIIIENKVHDILMNNIDMATILDHTIVNMMNKDNS